MAEDRMDRFERNLNRYAEESKQRMTHLEQFLANFSREVARNTLEARLKSKGCGQYSFCENKTIPHRFD